VYACLFVCLSICLSVGLSVFPLAFLTNRTSKFSEVVHTCYLRPWLGLRMMQCNMLCTSGFVDDVVLLYDGRKRPESKTARMFRPVHQMATPVGRQTATLFGLDRQMVAPWGGRSLPLPPTSSCVGIDVQVRWERLERQDRRVLRVTMAQPALRVTGARQGCMALITLTDHLVL